MRRPRTAAEIRALPWPEAVWHENEVLGDEDAYQVGRLLVEKVYQGDRAYQGRKEWSLRRLNSEVFSATSAATLMRCIQTFETARELGLKPPWKDVQIGHLFRIAGLDTKEKRRLLKRVRSEQWSVQQLQAAVGRLRGKSTKGRRPLPGFVRAINSLTRADILANLDRLSDLDSRRRRSLLKRVEVLQKDLKQIGRQLGKALSV